MPTLPFTQSLRFKLVAMFVGIFAAIQLLLGVTALVAREHYLYSRFDEQLTLRARHLTVDLLRLDEPFSRSSLAYAVQLQQQTIQTHDVFVQLVSPEGIVIERSANLGAFRLPFDIDTALPATTGDETLASVAGAEVEQLVGRGGALRMVTLYIDTPQARPFYLQAATSLGEVRESIAFVRTLFFIAMPAGLATAAVASWFAAGDAVRRITDVANLAHDLRPETLDDRLAPARSQDELGQMVDELNNALDRLEAGFRAQERFLQDASHELKTPVSVLLSEAQVLRRAGGEPETYQRFTASVEEEMHRMGKLIESLLILARADGRSAVATGRPVSLNDVAMAAIEQCDPLARQQNVTLVPRLAPETGAERDDTTTDELYCHGDSELLATMLSNLLRNAIRFTPHQQAVEVAVRRTRTFGLIEVRDHGPGVPEAERPRIFDRFVRGSNNGPHQGSGLGLTIARSIAELHQGDIHMQPADGGGSVFRVRLPLTPARARGPDPPTAHHERRSAA